MSLSGGAAPECMYTRPVPSGSGVCCRLFMIAACRLKEILALSTFLSICTLLCQCYNVCAFTFSAGPTGFLCAPGGISGPSCVSPRPCGLSPVRVGRLSHASSACQRPALSCGISPGKTSVCSTAGANSAPPSLPHLPFNHDFPGTGSPQSTPTETQTAGGTAEVFPFQAEVKRVLDIIVNSLYTDRDVFLRELISNAADASDKKRLLMEKAGRKFRGSIRVRADRERNTLTIEDDGIGMSKLELINNLGTIAQSGTYRFLQQLKEQQQQSGTGSGSQAASLIGQFGVGFYSAFLVADAVEVYSTAWRGASEDENQADSRQVWKWKSTCGQTFTLEQVEAKEERNRWLAEQKVLKDHWKKQKKESGGETTTSSPSGGEPKTTGQPGQEESKGEEEEEEEERDWSGTRVVLHLKEDSDDYLEDYKLKELMRKYSEFIQLPIHIWSERIEYERVPEGAETPARQGEAPSGDPNALPGLTRLTPDNVDAQLEDGSSQARGRSGASAAAGTSAGAPSSGKFRTVTHRFYEWEHLNTQPPIWRRDESQLTDKDYVDFYKSTF
ncbi:hsp90 domain-containing protein, partial [Cystoisospora suis]